MNILRCRFSLFSNAPLLIATVFFFHHAMASYCVRAFPCCSYCIANAFNIADIFRLELRCVGGFCVFHSVLLRSRLVPTGFAGTFSYYHFAIIGGALLAPFLIIKTISTARANAERMLGIAPDAQIRDTSRSKTQHDNHDF